MYLCRRLARSLGEAGEIEPETEGILMEHDVDYSDFSEEVSLLPNLYKYIIQLLKNVCAI